MDDAAIFLTAERLRREAGIASDVPLAVETLLPRLYPASCIQISGLSVQALRDWFHRQEVDAPPTLITCRDRRLRGGIVAWRGYGLLFADQGDSIEEIRFTFAHEAAHFLHDHLYPRLDLLQRFGPRIQPVLDGLRLPTRDERVDALLAHADLALHTHLLDRDVPLRWDTDAEIDLIESLADAFACELLAPALALRQRFPDVRLTDEAADTVYRALISEFHLPPAPARKHARAFVGEYGRAESLLERLRLI